MWDINVKVTNEQIRETNKQKLRDTDKCSVFQSEVWGGVKGKGGQTYDVT